MLIKLSSSSRSIRRYICHSCISSTILRYEVPVLALRNRRVLGWRGYSSGNSEGEGESGKLEGGVVSQVKGEETKQAFLHADVEKLLEGRAEMVSEEVGGSSVGVVDVDGQDGGEKGAEEESGDVEHGILKEDGEKTFTITRKRGRKRRGKNTRMAIRNVIAKAACETPQALILDKLKDAGKASHRSALISQSSRDELNLLIESGQLSGKETDLAYMFLNLMEGDEIDAGGEQKLESTKLTEESGSSKEAKSPKKRIGKQKVESTILTKESGFSKKAKALKKKVPKTPKKPRISRLSGKLEIKRTIGRLDVRKVGKFPIYEMDKGLAKKAMEKKDATTEKTTEKGPLKGMSIRQGMTSTGPVEKIEADELQLVPLEYNKRPVPALSYGLDRVLFNPGVYNLRDPRSRVFNFDPYLESIMPAKEFDFNALKEYITSSRDTVLISAASNEKKKYTGSTSSMTTALAHFHYLLSSWRLINTEGLSKSIHTKLHSFSQIQRAPSAVFLRWRDGVYAIDADKQFDQGTILMMLGKSMEKLLTLPTNEFEKYRKTSKDKVTEEQRNEPESFHYTTMGDFLMRSQLDAYDPRLPGTGMFDLKTRAVVSVRMDARNYTDGMDYEIRTGVGDYESYEREFYDMIRSAFLKYSLQVRMGRMDGIFVAFHNTQRIFGFQYISLPELDLTLHGTKDTYIGDSEFKLSIDLLNKILDRATAKFPEQSIRLHFETRPAGKSTTPFMYIFAEPITEEKIEKIQKTNAADIEEFERKILGIDEELESEVEETTENSGVATEDDRDDSIKDTLVAAIDADEDGDDSETQVVNEEDAEDQPDQDNEEIEDSEEIEELTETVEIEVNDGAKEGQTLESQGDSLQEYYDALARNFEEKDEAPAEKPTSDRKKFRQRPLLAMALTIRNRVNGEIVDRPEKLTSNDSWAIDYYFAEVKETSRAWDLYSKTKARRKMVFTDDDEPCPTNGIYLEKLRRMSRKGKQWRKQQDELDRKEGIYVYGEEGKRKISEDDVVDGSISDGSSEYREPIG